MANLEYITVPIETDPDELSQGAFDVITAAFPKWLPNEGNFEVIVIEAIASMMAEARDVAAVVPSAIFRYFGQTIMNIPAIEATNGSALANFVFNDNKGYEVPALTPLAFKNSNGEIIGFQTTSAFNCEVGQTEVKNIPIESILPGANSSGLSGAIQIVANFTFLKEVVLSSTTPETIGGQDEETDEAYLARLATELSLLAARPLAAKDFALIASNVPGVYRTLAINLYNPETGEENCEKCIALCPITELGAACSGPVKAALLAYIEERREVGFLVFIIEPTITEVDVAITVHAKQGANKEAVKLDVEEAIKNYINAGKWGKGIAGGTFPTWTNEPKVRRGNITTVANANPGVTYAELPTISKHGEALKAEDFTLPGHAPLPKAATVTVTVEIP